MSTSNDQCPVRLTITPEERVVLAEVAKKSGDIHMSEYVRYVLREALAARRVIDNPPARDTSSRRIDRKNPKDFPLTRIIAVKRRNVYAKNVNKFPVKYATQTVNSSQSPPERTQNVDTSPIDVLKETERKVADGEV